MEKHEMCYDESKCETSHEEHFGVFDRLDGVAHISMLSCAYCGCRIVEDDAEPERCCCSAECARRLASSTAQEVATNLV